jgi:hypothetical protein
MEIKNIIVIGDSFCASRPPWFPASWVSQLGQLTGCEIYGVGLGGRSWWKQQEWFDNNQKSLPDPNETAVVWCHTSAHRIPCASDAKINPWVVEITDHKDPTNDIQKDIDPNGKLFRLAKEFYLSDLYVEKFYAWAMQAWWQELALKLKPYRLALHFFAFNDLGIDYDDRLELLSDNSIVVVEPTLSAISKAEDYDFAGGAGDTRLNHFNAHNNLKLAEFVANTLQTVAGNSIVSVNNLSEWKLKTAVESSKFGNHKSKYGFAIKK